jgi:hypothetical protein
MRVPTWGVYVMWLGTLVGAVLLTMELRARGWPMPLTS